MKATNSVTGRKFLVKTHKKQGYWDVLCIYGKVTEKKISENINLREEEVKVEVKVEIEMEIEMEMEMEMEEDVKGKRLHTHISCQYAACKKRNLPESCSKAARFARCFGVVRYSTKPAGCLLS